MLLFMPITLLDFQHQWRNLQFYPFYNGKEWRIEILETDNEALLKMARAMKCKSYNLKSYVLNSTDWLLPGTQYLPQYN